MGVNIGVIRSFPQQGRGNMGSLESRYTNIGRFTLDVPRFVLVYYRAIVGQYGAPSDVPVTAPTGAADLEFRIDHASRISDTGGDGSGGAGTEIINYSFLIHKSPDFGVGNEDLDIRLRDEQMQAGQMSRGDYAVALWTNPETAGDLRWTLEVGLAELL